MTEIIHVILYIFITRVAAARSKKSAWRGRRIKLGEGV